jgi:hypothetical protein
MANTYNNTDLMQQACWAQIDIAALAEEKAQRMKDLISGVYAALSRYFDAITAIKGDPELTLQGKQSRIEAAAEQARRQLALPFPTAAELVAASQASTFEV